VNASPRTRNPADKRSRLKIGRLRVNFVDVPGNLRQGSGDSAGNRFGGIQQVRRELGRGAALMAIQQRPIRPSVRHALSQ
jgi:hypothetical protein